MTDVLQTEFEFELPMGFVDENGTRHCAGVMRLATAADEILPMKDPRVRSNPAYISIILLARVILRLGSLKMLNTHVVENLFARDFEYLQDLYNRVNKSGSTQIKAQCPKCEHRFEVEETPAGES